MWLQTNVKLHHHTVWHMLYLFFQQLACHVISALSCHTGWTGHTCFVVFFSSNHCVPFKNRCTNLLPHYKPRPPRPTHNAAAWSAGLVTPLPSVNMITTVRWTVLLLALGFCRGLKHNYIDDYEVVEVEEDRDLVFQPSEHGSLWPLPQKVQISDVSFKLMSSSFRIVDAKQSSAGPSCSLLQDAYRRWDAPFWFAVTFALCAVVRSGTCHSSTNKWPLSLSVCVRVCVSTGIMNTCSAALKGSSCTKAGEQAPPSWRSCRCGSRHLTLNVTGTPAWTPSSHVSVFLFDITSYLCIWCACAVLLVEFFCLWKKKYPNVIVYYIYCKCNLQVFILYLSISMFCLLLTSIQLNFGGKCCTS